VGWASEGGCEATFRLGDGDLQAKGNHERASEKWIGLGAMGTISELTPIALLQGRAGNAGGECRRARTVCVTFCTHRRAVSAERINETTHGFIRKPATTPAKKKIATASSVRAKAKHLSLISPLHPTAASKRSGLAWPTSQLDGNDIT
jgi:hypothetical protein